MTARRVLALLAMVGVAGVAVLGPAAPATAANTPPPTQRPHPKGTPPPKRAHPKLNQALPQGFNQLSIQTTPPVAGAKFTFAGTTVTTDSAGVATMLITPAQRLILRDNRTEQLVISTPTVDLRQGVRAQFTGWFGDGVYRAGVESQTATFEFDYLTGFDFTNLQGRALAPSLMSSLELQSSIGETIDLDTADPVWLQGSQVVTGSNGLQNKDVFYKINSVIVAGSNVVNSAQQRFVPSQRPIASVKLLFFSARFVATDAMFGGGVGKSIDLQYPDGTIRHIPFARGHAVTVDDLPRGDYHVTVVGGGLKMARPVSISRNQEADLDVISYLDVGVVGLVLGVVALAILWLGLQLRRRHRGYNRRMARLARRERKAARQEALRGAVTAGEHP